MIFARMKPARNFQFIGRLPDGARSLVIHEYLGGLTHGTFQPGSHPWMTGLRSFDDSSRSEVEVHANSRTHNLRGDADSFLVNGLARIESRLFVIRPGTQSVHVNGSTKIRKSDCPIRSQIEHFP